MDNFVNKELKVSVIMPVFNSEKYVKTAIDSVLNQTYKNIELVIINDGSTDNSEKVINVFNDNRIKYFKINNSGQCFATNYGLSHMTGEYIQFLDSDDLLHPEKIEKNMTQATKFGKNNIYISSWDRFYDSIENCSFNQKFPNREYYKVDDWISELWTYSMVSNSSYLFHKDILIKAGLYDVELSLHNDLDFFTRVVLSSEGVFWEKSAKAYYRTVIGSLTSQRAIKYVASDCKARLNAVENTLKVFENNEKIKIASINLLIRFLYEYRSIKYFTYIRMIVKKIKTLRSWSNLKRINANFYHKSIMLLFGFYLYWCLLVFFEQFKKIGLLWYDNQSIKQKFHSPAQTPATRLYN
jgi:glycosyltransferase involved in cell wall biosynthesis